MRRFAATVTAILLASAPLAQEPTPPAAVAPEEAAAPGGIVCGEPYVIRRGDTLQRLAVKVYGPEATFHALWAANRERLGLRDPSLIEIGQTIIAPCPISVAAALQAQAAAEAAPATDDETAPAETAPTGQAADAPMVVAPAAQSSGADTASASQPDPQPALIVARIPASPLAQAIALRALGETLGAGNFAVVDTPDAETSGLRFPLPRPDCAAGGATPEPHADCAALAWSAPLLEQTLVWHARADAEPLTDRASLAGMRICRSDTAPRAALAAPPGAQVQDGGPTRACLAAVAEGRADVAVSEAVAADATLRDRALAATLAEQPALTTLVELAAAAPKDDPLARAALAALELGLARMRASGAWFAQVDAALSLR